MKEKLFFVGFFKVGEFFSFDSLVDYKKTADNKFSHAVSSLLSSLKFNQRIKGLKSIARESSIQRPMSVAALSILMGLILFSYCFFGFMAYRVYSSKPKEEVMIEVKIDGKSQFLKINVQQKEMDYFDAHGATVGSLKVNELSNRLGVKQQIIKRENQDYLFPLAVGFVATIFLIIMLKEHFRGKRFYKKLRELALDMDLNYNKATAPVS